MSVHSQESSVPVAEEPLLVTSPPRLDSGVASQTLDEPSRAVPERSPSRRSRRRRRSSSPRRSRRRSSSRRSRRRRSSSRRPSRRRRSSSRRSRRSRSHSRRRRSSSRSRRRRSPRGDSRRRRQRSAERRSTDRHAAPVVVDPPPVEEVQLDETPVGEDPALTAAARYRAAWELFERTVTGGLVAPTQSIPKPGLVHSLPVRKQLPVSSAFDELLPDFEKELKKHAPFFGLASLKNLAFPLPAEPQPLDFSQALHPTQQEFAVVPSSIPLSTKDLANMESLANNDVRTANFLWLWHRANSSLETIEVWTDQQVADYKSLSEAMEALLVSHVNSVGLRRLNLQLLRRRFALHSSPLSLQLREQCLTSSFSTTGLFPPEVSDIIKAHNDAHRVKPQYTQNKPRGRGTPFQKPAYQPKRGGNAFRRGSSNRAPPRGRGRPHNHPSSTVTSAEAKPQQRT